MLGQFLTAMASTDAAVSGDDGMKLRNGLTVFPGEEPSDEELREWLKANVPVLRQTYGAAIRNVTPSHLIKYESGAAVTGFVEIVAGTPDALCHPC